MELFITQCTSITSSLTPPEIVLGRPQPLMANANKSFDGTKVYGSGFVLETEEAKTLLAKNSINQDVLFPYLNGEDLNTRPDQSSSRWVINFQDWTLEQSETYPDCIKIVREKVKPERDLNNRKVRRERWWQFAERAAGLYSSIKDLDRALAIPIVTKYVTCTWVDTNIVYSHALVVVASESDADYALLQCTFHDNWARLCSSSLGGTLRYTPTDSFETFPFPSIMQTLSNIGERYYQHRQSIMLSRQEGLTKTYNRFHDIQETAEDIVRLRALHKEMDEAVAKAYGWDDLELGHGFHETKQGLRYTISEEARREVLGRLLRLNHERYAEEVEMGLHEKGVKKGNGKKSGGKKNGDGGNSNRVSGEQGELVFG